MRRAQQRAGRGGDIALPHQAFADQEGLRCRRRASRARSAGVKMPLSPTDDAVARHHAAPGVRWLSSVVSKVLQVAIVDADQTRTQSQRALELVLVVHFDQHVHAERERGVFELLRRVRRRPPP